MAGSRRLSTTRRGSQRTPGWVATFVAAIIVPGLLAPVSAHDADGDHADQQGSAHQHGGEEGHLGPSAQNVDVVGRVRLTTVAEGIADVAAFGDYAYLAAFGAECPSKGGAGGGVHVVDIADPAKPTEVGFLPAEPNSFVGEGVHVFAAGSRVVLVHNNESCDRSRPALSGVSVWDVTDPRAPRSLGTVGDRTPAVGSHVYHQTHSAQGFWWRDRAYVAATDNNERRDIDIFDITPLIAGTGPGLVVSETGVEDYPAALDTFGYGMNLQHHDMQQKVIDGRNLLLVSYWDAGQLLLNIDDPSRPTLVADSDWSSPDPLFASFATPEGNSHQSYWSADNQYILSTDEDFDSRRVDFRIVDGPAAGEYWASSYSWTRPLDNAYPQGFSGSTVFGGSGCTTDVNRNGTSDREEVPRREDTGADAVVFAATGCAFSMIVQSGALAGYPIVLVAAPHARARGGQTPDGFFCGFAAHQFDASGVSGFCTGHRQLHLLFDDEPAYSGENMADLPPIGTIGRRIALRSAFDGWGYVHLHDAETLAELDAFTISEAADPAFAHGSGDLTVHEVKADPRPGKNIAYASWYSGGLRVLAFDQLGIREIGFFVDQDGSNYWGVYPHFEGRGLTDGVASRAAAARARPLILVSDRDYGLVILRYTGRE